MAHALQEKGRSPTPVGVLPAEESTLMERRILIAEDNEANRAQIRIHLTRKYAFGVPGDHALDCLARYAPIVEMGGQPVGIVTATDLMYLESRTPFALRRSIAHAASVEALVESASHLPQMIVALLRASYGT